MINTVKIGIHQYSVSEAEDITRKSDGAFLFGHISHDEQHIDVRAALQPKMKAVCLWHELIHGVLFQAGLLIDEGDEERVCVALSHGIVQLLQDNPELADYTLDKSEAGKK